MAGGQDKILWSLSLEGAEDVSKKLKAAGDVGDEQAKRLKQSFGDVAAGNAGSHGFEAEAGESGAHRLREALHVLHPILDEAGLGLGNLGAFARLAGAGFGALTAAIVGSVVVGLAKLADQAAATKKQLDDLSSGHGGDHFAGLRADAKRLGTDVDNLLPAYKQALGLRNDLQASNRKCDLCARRRAVQPAERGAERQKPACRNQHGAVIVRRRQSRGSSKGIRGLLRLDPKIWRQTDARGAAGRRRRLGRRRQPDCAITTGGFCELPASD
jgi:hypothetical protein